jgi:hypothetical protein
MSGLWATLLTNICPGFVFSLLGVIAALWYENRGASRLFLIPHITTSNVDEDNPAAIQRRFLHIKIRNQPRRSPFVTRRTAFSCHGTVSFYEFYSDQKVGYEIPIKWDGAPDPVKFEISNEKLIKVIDPPLFRATRFMDIAPDEEESLAFAIRLNGDEYAYGWSVDSYLNGWRLPTCELPPGKYRARVKVISGDGVFEADVFFRNTYYIGRFDLLPGLSVQEMIKRR